jgi:glycosyltransferase involved in cell wall biosynthesis
MVPYFSIVIPTYNRAEMLRKAVSSVLSQTFGDWELVIIDDGSTDHTREVVQGFSDERIVYHYQENRERSAARNKGIELSKGKYICFLDSDDYFLPQRLEFLEREIKSRQEPRAMLYTGISFEKNGEVRQRPELILQHDNKHDFFVQAVIGVPQTCIRREILEKHQFDPRFRIGEDLELWLRIIDEYHFIRLDMDHSVVAVEHEERSVNTRKYDSGRDELRMLRFIFSDDHPGRQVTSTVRRNKISNTLFSIAKYNIGNQKNMRAIACLLRSITASPLHSQTKHKFNLLFHLLTFRRIKEYQDA